MNEQPTNCLWLCLATLFLSFSLTAQKATIEGAVRLDDDSAPVANVFLYLDGTGISTISNGQGEFRLTEVPAGSHELIASCMGFSTIQKTVAVGEGETLRLNLNMEELVTDLPYVVVQRVSLTGGLKGLRDIPGSAHYLSPKDIERFSYTDINRTLRTVPGLNLQEEDGFGLRPNIGLRGTGSERSSKITIMEDGVLAAPAPYSAPAAYYFPTIGRMQGVEVLKGSSQIRFGPYTTGGAINLLSTAIPEEFSGRFHLMGGNFGNRNLHAYAGNSHRNFAYLAETFQYQSNGFKELENEGETGFDKKDYLIKFRVNTNPDARIYQSLTFKAAQANETSDETYLGLTSADFDQTPYLRYAASQHDRMDTRHEQYSLRHLIQFPKLVDVTTTVYRSNFHRNWYKLDKVIDGEGAKTGIADILRDPLAYTDAYQLLRGNAAGSDNTLEVKANNRSYRSEGIQTVIGLHFDAWNMSHKIDVGLRYHYDEVDRFQWIDDYRMYEGIMKLTAAGEEGTESNRVETARAFAGYVQYKIKAGRWGFIPGIRHENILLDRTDYGKEDPERAGTELSFRENQVDVWIPGIGIDYKVNEAVNLFAGVHKGFSPPSSREGSNPEESINYEAGIRYRHGGLSGQAVLFYNDFSNLLGADLAAAGGTGSADLYNGGEVETKGLEFQLTYDLLATRTNGISMPLSIVYTYTDAVFQSSFDSEFEGWGAVTEGDALPYLSSHQLSLVYSLDSKKWGFNLSGRYQSAMRTQPGQGEIPTAEKIDGYFIIDANASYVLSPRVMLFGSITNLTNEVYLVAQRPAGLRPGLPRALMGGLKVNF